MYYINYKYKTLPTETIDRAETRQEAYYLLNEYVRSNCGGKYTISRKEY